MKKINREIVKILIITTALFYTFLLLSCSTTRSIKYRDNLGNEIDLDTTSSVIIRIPDELRNLSYFPTGTFLAGEDEYSIQRGSAPALHVSLSSFLMDKNEVSNLEYFSFLDTLKLATRSEAKAAEMMKKLIKDRGRVEKDIETFFTKICLALFKHFREISKFL